MVPLVDKPVALENNRDNLLDLDKLFDIRFDIHQHIHCTLIVMMVALDELVDMIVDIDMTFEKAVVRLVGLVGLDNRVNNMVAVAGSLVHMQAESLIDMADSMVDKRQLDLAVDYVVEKMVQLPIDSEILAVELAIQLVVHLFGRKTVHQLNLEMFAMLNWIEQMLAISTI